MNEIVDSLNFILALSGVILVLSSLYLIYDLNTERILQKHIQRYGILFCFFFTLGGGIMTLIYSEIFGFIPCGLCWLQRVFLYPQIFLTGTALWLKENTVVIYGIVLSIPGLMVGLYQHYLQMGGSELVGCPAAGAGADCSERIMFEFGFMTFPLLSAIMFGFLIVFYYYIHKTS